ncbi:MAG: autotransporter outer membrane beta-barrel domain-containing protein, partial [Achromobacter sp.]|nr:autotransporter outer membrane beta-barrel domain-containing protein [Achromobacter sp.]
MNSRNPALAATAARPRRRSHSSLGGVAALITMLASPFFEPQAHAQTYTGNDTTGGPFASGDQSFRDNSALNAATANAVSGGRQTFEESSVLNASVGSTVSGGEQGFYDSSALNATAANAIDGGEQAFSDTSMLNASAGSAVNRGKQYFYGTATLNAVAVNAVSGGIQAFNGSSVLNASASGALNGGEQSFNVSNVLNATVSGAVSGGFQAFYGTSQLNALAADAISGGIQDFFDSSRLNASVAGAVGAGVKYFSDSSVLDVQSDNALTNRVDVRFDLLGGSAPGGILRLNGHSTVVGRINSEAAGAGIITNDGAADSALTVDSSRLANSSFSGRIQDGGVGALGLVKTGAGTLRLSGANTYRGGTTVTGGILQVSRDANLGAASGGLVLNGGTLATTASFDSGRTVTLAGVGQFDVAADTELGLTGALSGAGRLIKLGAGALVQAGNSAAFTGSTVVSAGSLIVGPDAARAAVALGGSVSVQDGARLGGHGTVGSGAGSVVTVEPGGMLAPGNSIGTLTVNGDLVVARGARYEVEVDPASTASDLTRVTGKATLNGGSVALVGNAGSYALRSTYTILTADQGLSGAFEGVASRYAFLDPTLSYDANNAYLNLARNDVSFVDAARTRNQVAVARAIERIGVNAANPVYDAVVQLPTAAAARGAFDQLSGEILASARTALIEDSRHVREAATDRLRAAWGGAGASTASMTLHGRQAGAAGDGPEGKAAWSRGFGAWGRTGGDGNAARLNHSTGGFLLGTDARLSQHWRAGALAGYSRTRFDAGNASGSSDNFHLGLYGGAQWGRLGLRLGAAHTWHALRVSRPVAFAGYADALKADYRAGTTQVF